MDSASAGTGRSFSSGTRESLLSRARQRNPDAWRELVELYGPLIAHWCHRCGLDSSATADCVQEVFISVWRNLEKFQPRRANGAFRAWVWTITGNRIRDLARRDRQHPRADGGSSALNRLREIPDGNEVPQCEPSSQELLGDLFHRALEQVRSEFEERTWAIFIRSVVDQVPTDIVAAEFSIQPATIRQIRSRILRRLRQQLGDCDD